MPFRIDVLDEALTPERQAALADVLVHAGVEPEAAALAAMMTPGPVVDVDTDDAYQTIGAALTAAGFTVEAAEYAETPGARPAARPAAAKSVPAFAWLAGGLGLVVVLLAGVLIGTWTRPDAEPTPVVTTDTPPGVSEARRPDPEPVVEPDPPADAPAGWTTGPTALPGPSDAGATLQTIRTGRHAGYDRVVFEFDGAALPAVAISFGGTDAGMCDSDATVSVSGRAALHVRFAAALGTFGSDIPASVQRQSPRLSTVRDIVSTCWAHYPDTAWVLGLAESRPYRTQVLRNPLRLVVDVQA